MSGLFQRPLKSFSFVFNYHAFDQGPHISTSMSPPAFVTLNVSETFHFITFFLKSALCTLTQFKHTYRKVHTVLHTNMVSICMSSVYRLFFRMQNCHLVVSEMSCFYIPQFQCLSVWAPGPLAVTQGLWGVLLYEAIFFLFHFYLSCVRLEERGKPTA